MQQLCKGICKNGSACTRHGAIYCPSLRGHRCHSHVPGADTSALEAYRSSQTKTPTGKSQLQPEAFQASLADIINGSTVPLLQLSPQRSTARTCRSKRRSLMRALVLVMSVL
jgi:hypothetical protein